MEMANPSGTLNEYFQENIFSTTPDCRENQNVCPEKKMTLSVAEMEGRSRKDIGLNLRKSLAWNSAFFTEEGVLDPSELSKISDSVTKRSNRLSFKENVENSSMIQFDKFSKRPPLHNLKENFFSELQARPTPRSVKKKPTKLLSISEESSHGPLISSARRKSSIKGITKDVPKFDVAYSTSKKGKTEALHSEKDASLLKLNYRPLSSKRIQMDMNSSVPTPIQATHSALRGPSQRIIVEKAKTKKPLFQEGTNLLKLKSCPSFSSNSPATSSGSAGIISSVPQQTFNGPSLPPPTESKPSALRVPSPSLGFFQQNIVTSSHSNQLHSTSHVTISGISSLRRPTKLKHLALSKPSVAQTEQQLRRGTFPAKTSVCPRTSSSTAIYLNANSSKLSCTDFEARTERMEIKHIDVKETITSNVYGSSNSSSDVAKENISNRLSELDEKTGEVIGKPSVGRAKESSKQITSSIFLTEGTGTIGRVLHSNDFESTSDSIMYSIGSSKTEISSTSSEMHFLQNLDKSNSKHLCVPSMNGDLIMSTDEGGKPDVTYVDTIKERISSGDSDFISNSRLTFKTTSEKADVHIEPRSELSEEFNIHNTEEHFHNIIPTGEDLGNSSQDVHLVEPEECQPHQELGLRNESNSTKENALMPAKNIALDTLNHTTLLKDQLSYVPYSEEWLAAVEAFGEDILEVKTGTVHNSPPDKAIPELGPWSPVKRKAQDVGPFDCTKYIKNPAPSGD